MRTWYTDEDYLLSLPILASGVLLGHAALSWVIVGDGDPAVNMSAQWYYRYASTLNVAIWPAMRTYPKTTSSGNLSPVLRGIVWVICGVSTTNSMSRMGESW